MDSGVFGEITYSVRGGNGRYLYVAFIKLMNI